MVFENSKEYSSNENKIYSNKCQHIYEQVNVDILLNEYMELKSLFELFKDRASSKRTKELKNREKQVDSRYKPIIKDAKRSLKNTEKRLTYHIHVVTERK